MTSKIAPPGERLGAGRARVSLGILLNDGGLNGSIGHVLLHLGLHLSLHLECHAGGSHVGLRHVDRGLLHGAGGTIRARVLHLAVVHRGLRVSGVLGAVRRVGALKRKRRELLVLGHGLLKHLTRGRLCAVGHDTLLVEHAGDAHNLAGGWRRHG